MPPSETRRHRLLPIIILLLLVLLLGLSIRWWRSSNPSAPVIPAPPTPVTPSPRTPPKEIPRTIPPIKKTVPKAPVKKQSHPTPVVPARPVSPAVPIPYHPYVPAPTPPSAEPQEWMGTDTSITREGQIVVHTEEQWIHFWTEHHPDEAAPDVDFTRSMVVGVFVGSRPADQFSVSIVNVQTQSDSIVVDYRERNPPTGTFSMGVSVHPYALKAIPRSALRVKFNKLISEQP